MAVLAFLLAVWGLWKEIEQQPQVDSQSIQIDSLDSAEETESPSIDSNNKLQELQLEFQHDVQTGKQNNTQRNKSDNNKTNNEKQIKTPDLTRNNPADKLLWQKIKIRSGDSMARVFQKLGFSPSDLHAIISLGETTAALKKIKPGKFLEYIRNAEGELEAIRYSLDKLSTLTVNKIDNSWTAIVETKELEIRQANTMGSIDSSLFLAGVKAGLTDAMVMELAAIFGWDIDFILDIRDGDEFTVIYEEKYVDGEKIGNGNILAAEFINQGKSYKSVRYTDSSGRSEYYTPSGLSMRKAFLRAPVDFSYISSKFNPRRFHPILKRVTAHNGIDYVAPKGTPVKAAGDGKVIAAAYSKYNGNYVFVQHGQKYITKYLHFSKRAVHTGQKVHQGQIIGYVGSTGMAEAAHLHYEFLVNGVHRNPRTVQLPDAKPINRKEKSLFIEKTRELVQQLEIQSHVYTEQRDTAD